MSGTPLTANRGTIDQQRADRSLLLAELEAAGADVSRPGSIRCPYHEDRHPSGGVYERGGVWRYRCHGCDAGGDVFDLRAVRQGTDAAAQLREARGDSREPTVSTSKPNPSGNRHGTRPTRRPETDSKTVGLPAMLKRLQDQLTPERLGMLAAATGLPGEAWAKLRPGWCTADDLRTLKAGGSGWREDYPDGAWCVPEHDGRGTLVGLALRTADGRKGSPSKSATGGGRGLVVPDRLQEQADRPVLIVEGASDVAACAAVGGRSRAAEQRSRCVGPGRPSGRAGRAGCRRAGWQARRSLARPGRGQSGGTSTGRDLGRAGALDAAGRSRQGHPGVVDRAPRCGRCGAVRVA